MKYLIFSVLLMLALYGVAIIVTALCRQKAQREVAPLSKDVGNCCKGFAIAIIMLAHIGNVFGVRYLTPLGSWGVGIFLFLSGFGLTVSTEKKGLENYWKNRIVVAWLPYVVVECIGFLLCPTAEYFQLQWQDILLDLLLIRTIHPFGWYMQCLFLYYLGFYLANRLCRNNKPGKYAILSALCVVLFLCFRSLFKQQVFPFVFGVLIADDRKLREKLVSAPLNGLLCLIAGAMCLLVRQTAVVRSLVWVHESVFAIQVLLLTLGTVNAMNWLYAHSRSVLLKPALLLGVVSYEIYLYHGWILDRISEETVSYLTITLFFIGSIAIAIAIHWVWDKWMGRLKGRMRKSPK